MKVMKLPQLLAVLLASLDQAQAVGRNLRNTVGTDEEAQSPGARGSIKQKFGPRGRNAEEANDGPDFLFQRELAVECPNFNGSPNPTPAPVFTDPTTAGCFCPTETGCNQPSGGPDNMFRCCGSPTPGPDFRECISGATMMCVPTAVATPAPTDAPVAPPDTDSPTKAPSASPSEPPTAQPTKAPSASPSKSPTAQPTKAPSASPSEPPTAKPTKDPSASPSESPTAQPTKAPTASPTEAPTASPTEAPTAQPTKVPTQSPTAMPTMDPEVCPPAYQLPQSQCPGGKGKGGSKKGKKKKGPGGGKGKKERNYDGYFLRRLGGVYGYDKDGYDDEPYEEAPGCCCCRCVNPPHGGYGRNLQDIYSEHYGYKSEGYGPLQEIYSKLYGYDTEGYAPSRGKGKGGKGKGGKGKGKKKGKGGKGKGGNPLVCPSPYVWDCGGCPTPAPVTPEPTPAST